MTRWLEQFEIKHVEMMRCIKSFYHLHAVWASMAAKSSQLGHAAFARQQASMFLDLHDNAKDLFAEKGEPRFVSMNDSTVVQTVRAFRNQELGWLYELARVGDRWSE